MNFLKRHGFTKRELLILVFLFITFITGLVIKLSGFNKLRKFDYSKSDRVFEENLKKSFEELENEKRSAASQNRISQLRFFADSLMLEAERTALNKKKISPDVKININTALSSDLEMLPGVGRVTAERILDFREKYGRFKSIEEIKKIKGIGEKKFEKMKDFIVTE
jgi:competence protein ComEA